MAKDEKQKEPGGDKVISGARTSGIIFEKLFKYSIGFAAIFFIGAATSYGVGEARCNYLNKKRKEDKNG